MRMSLKSGVLKFKYAVGKIRYRRTKQKLRPLIIVLK